MLIFSLVLAIGFVVIASGVLKLHLILALLLAAFGFGIAAGLPAAELPGIISSGFGGTVGSVGPIILFGAIIGVFLERSGGAMRLAEGLLSLVGKRNVAPAMGGAGFVISIPVFCDSGFIILSPLNRALSRAAGATVTAGAIALALGLYAAHTMVPPTPGPVAAADLVGADLGRVLLLGLPIALITATVGIAFAMLAGRQLVPALKVDNLEVSPAAVGADTAVPSIWLSILPLVIPIGSLIPTLKTAEITSQTLRVRLPAARTIPIGLMLRKNDWCHSNSDQVDALVAAGFDAMGVAHNVTLPSDALIRSLDVLENARVSVLVKRGLATLRRFRTQQFDFYEGFVALRGAGKNQP